MLSPANCVGSLRVKIICYSVVRIKGIFVFVSLTHAQIQRGGGGGGVRNPMKNHKNRVS